jgi:integrase
MPRRRAQARFTEAEAGALAQRTVAVVDSSRGSGAQANRRCALGQWEEFCWAFARQPAYPVYDFLLGPFLVQWADRNHSSKVQWLVSAIKCEALEAHGQDFDAYLKRYIARVRRGLEKLYAPVVKRKMPMTLDRLEATLHTFDLGDPWDLQLLTMAYVAHDGLLRACELVNLRWEDVTMEEDGTVRLTIRESKVSMVAEEAVFSPYERYGVDFCGATLLKWYMEHRASTGPARPSGWVFPSATRAKLPKTRFVAAFQAKLVRAALPGHDDFSGHSFRAGGATDLFDGGAPSRIVQLCGRWRSEAYLLYIRDHWFSRSHAAAQAFAHAGGGIYVRQRGAFYRS